MLPLVVKVSYLIPASFLLWGCFLFSMSVHTSPHVFPYAFSCCPLICCSCSSDASPPRKGSKAVLAPLQCHEDALRTPTLSPWASRQQHVHFWACCCKVTWIPLTVHTPLWKSLLCLHLVPCAVCVVQGAQEQENKMCQVCDSKIMSVLSCMTLLPSLWWLLLWK